MTFPAVLNELRLRDHSVEPPIETTQYPVFVQSVDADGNALGGIRHPLLDAPLATHVGWSLRATGYGEGDLFTIQGSMIPFAATEAERQRASDPRPSLGDALRIARSHGQRSWRRPSTACSPIGCCWPRTPIG